MWQHLVLATKKINHDPRPPTVRNVREGRRRKLLKAVGLHTSLVFLFGLLILAVLIVWGSAYGVGRVGEDNYCNPSGEFDAPMDYAYNPWTASGFFTISLGFGNLSFNTVKIIDVIWDVVIGRGGQAILAIIAYHIFTKTLLRTIEETDVNYETYNAMVFNTASLAMIMTLITNFHTNSGHRGRFAIFWVIVGTLYVVVFPTLLSAMTGYRANMVPYVTVDQNLTPWSDFNALLYVIRDGWRIGLTGEFSISEGRSIWEQFMEPQIENYISHYGANGTNNTSSYFYMNSSAPAISLAPPSFNIMAYQTLTYGLDYNQAMQTWVLNNKTYTLDYVNENGSCVPAKTYQWGFSWLLLFIVVILHLVWSFGMYTMWMDSYCNSGFHRARRGLGTYRATLDMAAAMCKELGDENAEKLSNKGLRRRLKRVDNGGRITYKEEVDRSELPLSRLEYRRNRKMRRREARRGPFIVGHEVSHGKLDRLSRRYRTVEMKFSC